MGPVALRSRQGRNVREGRQGRRHRTKDHDMLVRRHADFRRMWGSTGTGVPAAQELGCHSPGSSDRVRSIPRSPPKADAGLDTSGDPCGNASTSRRGLRAGCRRSASGTTGEVRGRSRKGARMTGGAGPGGWAPLRTTWGFPVLLLASVVGPSARGASPQRSRGVLTHGPSGGPGGAMQPRRLRGRSRGCRLRTRRCESWHSRRPGRTSRAPPPAAR